MHAVSHIPAFKDNYIWIIRKSESPYCVCVDPGDAKPVLQYLAKENLILSAILITHHHWDHTNGIKLLTEKFSVPVYGPEKEKVIGVTQKVQEGERIYLEALDLEFTVLDIPGHTLGHVGYYGQELLFSGDTLFAAGCGKLLEGTARQLYTSLQKLAALPPQTKIYCGHEYTVNNLRFAEYIEAGNPTIKNRLLAERNKRQSNEPTLPSTLELDLATNPFLRCHEKAIVESASHHARRLLSDPVEIFSTIRLWKDSFI